MVMMMNPLTIISAIRFITYLNMICHSSQRVYFDLSAADAPLVGLIKSKCAVREQFCEPYSAQRFSQISLCGQTGRPKKTPKAGGGYLPHLPLVVALIF
jgi:hypothetical protein